MPNAEPPPQRSRATAPFVGLGRVDFVMGAVAFGILLAIDVAALSVGRHSDDDALFWAWVVIQTMACLVGGLIEAVRRRPLAEVFAVGGIATAALILGIMTVVNPDAGSSDCPGQGPCDTSFGLGYVLIALVVIPILSGVAALGHVATKRALRAVG